MVMVVMEVMLMEMEMGVTEGMLEKVVMVMVGMAEMEVQKAAMEVMEVMVVGMGMEVMEVMQAPADMAVKVVKEEQMGDIMAIMDVMANSQ
ncbi:hypothetical protein HHZ41_002150 [Salmonella enterica]|nr:hypothetical protein [Salmonella enterica]EHI4417708.1 hypothetical protein [Salmonella enterica]